ncbi:hypothetical protein TURU_104618 [Turdus rufiventris]|nr:hypothetical protein TURU_104618 [Turdus rufiventris]
MLVVLDSEIIDVGLSIWKYVFSVTMVNKNALKDGTNSQFWNSANCLVYVLSSAPLYDPLPKSFGGVFLSPTVADCLVASPHLQPDIGISSVVMAVFITLSNVFLKTRFCPEVVQALGAQLVQSYNPMEYLGQHCSTIFVKESLIATAFVFCAKGIKKESGLKLLIPQFVIHGLSSEKNFSLGINLIKVNRFNPLEATSMYSSLLLNCGGVKSTNKLTPEVTESSLLLFHLYNLEIEDVKDKERGEGEQEGLKGFFQRYTQDTPTLLTVAEVNQIWVTQCSTFSSFSAPPKAMWLMLQTDEPEDFVIATGEVHSVREFVEKSFKHIGKTIVWEGKNENEVGRCKETGKIHVTVNHKYYRPTEVVTKLEKLQQAHVQSCSVSCLILLTDSKQEP